MIRFIEIFIEAFIIVFMAILQIVILISGFSLPVIIMYYTHSLWTLLSGMLTIPFAFGLFKAIDSLAR